MTDLSVAVQGMSDLRQAQGRVEALDRHSRVVLGDLGVDVAEECRRRGLRKQQLANRTGLNSAAVTRACKGEPMTRETALRLLRTLERSSKMGWLGGMGAIVRPHVRVLRPEPPDNKWTAAVRDFLGEKRRRGLSPKTLVGYQHTLLLNPHTRRWLQQQSIADASGLTAATLRVLETTLQDAGQRPASVAGFHRIFKNFAKWAIEEGYGVDPRVLHVPGPKLPVEAPEVFTTAEQKIILEACICPRDQVIVLTLLYTGVRLAELCNLTVDDIMQGPEGSWLRVRQGKGRKDRAVPLDRPGVPLSAVLRRFIARERPTAESRHLFLTSRRDRATGRYEPLVDQSVKVLLRRIGATSGLHVHAHKFRHTFATEAIASGVNPLSLQRALGHTTLAMTNRYVHHRTDDLVAEWMMMRDPVSRARSEGG